MYMFLIFNVPKELDRRQGTRIRTVKGKFMFILFNAIEVKN